MSVAFSSTLISGFSHFPSFRLKSSIPISFHKFPTSKTAFVSGFLPRRYCPQEFRNFGEKQMTEMSRISAFRGTEETEAIIGDGSAELRREFRSGGFDSIMNKLSKWLVAALFGSVIILKHDAEALWAAMGAVLNSSLSIALKQILNQQRPASALRSDPGMPSSHAQSIFYTVVLAVLSLVEWLGINALTLTTGAFILICGSYFTWLRVSQRLHTISQVVVGATLGSIFSVVWFWSWHEFVLKEFDSFLWVQIVVVLGSASCCLGFLLYVIRCWLMEEN